MDQICRIDEIEEGQSKGLDWGEHKLIAVKHQGQLYLYLNRCPHRGIPLEWQPDQFLDLERQFIQCSTHGALFRIETGDCIQGPCQGQALQPIEYSLRDGTVWVEPIATEPS
ncbi:Rieske (2Fe-2S) protein [Motiliproteus sp.]|uniref:Rieske (2Fe-2S) protein n=1 Tax=Motiliproteus sp. TaxID=1898955 RepID=UPI003BAA34B6